MSSRFETFSYLPPLSPGQTQAQAEYILKNGWIPTIEWAEQGESNQMYWQIWPLSTPSTNRNPRQALKEMNASVLMMQIEACSRRHPQAYIRVSGYHATARQTETSFLVHVPAASSA